VSEILIEKLHNRPLFAAFRQTVSNPYEAQRNPKGIINCGTAEKHRESSLSLCLSCESLTEAGLVV